MSIDASRQIAETLYFPLRCVDALQGEGLSYVLRAIFGRMYYTFSRCVDLASETLTG
ncbi:MAG: hypothetical protein SAL70_20380 [Scytonema sp. PMC 1070.18]|nr:hypothetical protein [Scytonema sp. PMC 1070.18]